MLEDLVPRASTVPEAVERTRQLVLADLGTLFVNSYRIYCGAGSVFAADEGGCEGFRRVYCCTGGAAGAVIGGSEGKVVDLERERI